jgi:hypothetical protein
LVFLFLIPLVLVALMASNILYAVIKDIVVSKGYRIAPVIQDLNVITDLLDLIKSEPSLQIKRQYQGLLFSFVAALVILVSSFICIIIRLSNTF